MAIPRLKDEVWKPIDWIYDKEGKLIEGFFISNKGRGVFMERVLTPDVNEEGYETCNMGGKRYKVHRLVATAFVPNEDPEHNDVVDHIDGRKQNNASSNLRWVTRQENTRAAYANGLIKTRDLTDILVVDQDDIGTLYSSQIEAANATGIDSNLVNKVARGAMKTIRGLRFIKIRELHDKRRKSCGEG